ncbi:hypothetical protein MNB_SUP05-5-684 [hydrothermal vent metagenome]|uniref:Uncharacterized protein n=1 Tax=hydrothermal vent metagenome TaxID=652676 RepID=A0A1W1C7N7_9ZZZZ
MLPKINISRSAELVLKKYWQDLNDKQKNMVEQYIIHSLINDYASFLLT